MMAVITEDELLRAAAGATFPTAAAWFVPTSAVSGCSSSAQPQRQAGTLLGTLRPHSGHTRLKAGD
jgi:hypothetical protein